MTWINECVSNQCSTENNTSAADFDLLTVVGVCMCCELHFNLLNSTDPSAGLSLQTHAAWARAVKSLRIVAVELAFWQLNTTATPNISDLYFPPARNLNFFSF